jgi:hypothetical protein
MLAGQSGDCKRKHEGRRARRSRAQGWRSIAVAGSRAPDVEYKRKAGREGGRAGDVEDKRGAGHTRADLLEVPLRVDARPRSRRRCHHRCEGQYLEVRLSLHPRREGEQHDGHPSN